MNRLLKRIIGILFLAVIALVAYNYFSGSLFNRPLSPKDTVEFTMNDLTLEVFYNRPSKRDRIIFGGLVPYDQVWRTGANEATTFETNRALVIGNDTLQPGLYTLWTIPGADEWEVIFNRKQYPWGVDEQLNPMREPAFDALSIKIPTEPLTRVVEQFTIGFDNSTGQLYLTLAWDQVKIAVPLD